MKVSMVTACRNRVEHLSVSAGALSKTTYHDEHVIVDWGSDPPIAEKDLPNDPRIRLYRVSRADDWWLTHAYNLGFSLASGEIILKIDADCHVTDRFFEKNLELLPRSELLCSRLTLQDWVLGSTQHQISSSGIFLVSRTALHAVNGFNPYIKHWGWDEVDLHSRIFLAGYPVQRLIGDDICEIDHDSSLRLESRHFGALSYLVVPQLMLESSNMLNSAVAKKSIERHVDWPDLSSYQQHFREHHTPPPVDMQIKDLLGSIGYRTTLRRMFATAFSGALGRNVVSSGVSKAVSLCMPVRAIERLFGGLLCGRVEHTRQESGDQ